MNKESSEEKEGKSYRFKKLEMIAGISENGYTEIILPEGFDKNSKIVINGVYDLLSKMNNVKEEEYLK